jgi:hypothetical protein
MARPQAVLQQQSLQGTQGQGILQQLPTQMWATAPPLGSIAAVKRAGVVSSAGLGFEQEQERAATQRQQQQQQQQQGELLPAVLPPAAAAAAATSGLGPAGLSLVEQELAYPWWSRSWLIPGGAGAGLSLVEQELGALPSQQQLQ